MESSQGLNCLKHKRHFQLIGVDQACQLNCQVCCDCLRGVDHGHKKGSLNHETIGMEQLNHIFEQIMSKNIECVSECKNTVDSYFKHLEELMREALGREKERINKLIHKVMLTDISKDERRLNIITSLYQRDYSHLKCRDVGEVAKELFQFVPKPPSQGFKQIIQYINSQYGQIASEFKSLIATKHFQNIVLINLEKDISYPDFGVIEKEELKVSRIKTEDKESPKKTLRRSVKKESKMDRSLLELKDMSIQIHKPVDFVGSKLIQGKEENLFINRLFQHRKIANVKLLYRASENDFSVKRFHQHCDNESDTIVFVQTEFHKIIGGYTPIHWKSTANTLHFDVKSQSFLFSLSLKQKMSLVDEKSAIFNSINFGPTFGAGADLAICHNGNVEKTSYSQFPYSYGNSRYKESSQHSTALFTGQKHGNHFLLKEWEVWKVLFLQ